MDITGVSPIGNVSGYSPKIQASFRDRRGTPLSRDDIRVRLDGREIRNFQYRRTTGNLSFAVGRLAPGSHTVQVEVSGNGKGARKTWSFVVG